MAVPLVQVRRGGTPHHTSSYCNPNFCSAFENVEKPCESARQQIPTSGGIGGTGAGPGEWAGETTTGCGGLATGTAGNGAGETFVLLTGAGCGGLAAGDAAGAPPKT